LKLYGEIFHEVEVFQMTEAVQASFYSNFLLLQSQFVYNFVYIL